LRESQIIRREEGSSGLGGVLEILEKTGLVKTQLQSAELTGQKLDNLERIGRGKEKRVDTVNDSVGPELKQ
jgi:hypothetical protein